MMTKSKAKLGGKSEMAGKILEKKLKALSGEANKFVTQVNSNGLWIKMFDRDDQIVQRLEEAYKLHKAVMAGEKPKPEEMKKWAENTISSYKVRPMCRLSLGPKGLSLAPKLRRSPRTRRRTLQSNSLSLMVWLRVSLILASVCSIKEHFYIYFAFLC